MPRPLARPVRPALAPLLALVLACGGGGAGTNTGATDDAGGSTAQPVTGTQGPTTGHDGTTTGTTGNAATTGTGGPASTSTAATTGAISSSSTDTTTSATDGASTTGSTGTTGTTTGTTGDTAGTDDSGDSGTNSTTGTGGTTDSTGGGGGELGVISGDCGLIDAMEIESPDPFVFSGAIDFGVVGYDYELLTPGGQEIYDDGNLNPSSIYSEIVAYEVLARCDLAVLLKTEGEIVYQDPMGKKTDFLVELDGHKVGVSVVRAVAFPFDAPYTVQQAEAILTDKLGDILVSSQNVAPEDAWVKQILSVVAYGPMHRDSLLAAYAGLPAMVKADTIVVITVTDGDDAFIY